MEKITKYRRQLTTITPLKGRGDISTFKNFTIIDETYNSNPEALKRSLKWVDKEYTTERIAVLGDMLELGDNEERFHLQVGYYFSTLNYKWLITVGKRAEKIAEGAIECGVKAEQVHSFDSADEAGKFIKKMADKDAAILFKASRGIQLEKAIAEFKKMTRRTVAVIGFGKTGRAVLDFFPGTETATACSISTTIYLSTAGLTGRPMKSRAWFFLKVKRSFTALKRQK